MEPKLPSSNRGSEKLPQAFDRSIEHSLSIPIPEKPTEYKRERAEPSAESTPLAPSQTILPPPVTVAVPAIPQPINNTSQTTDAPLVAADEDLIEKEWVDKAKAILAQTKDDPYLREKEVSKLQADYLQKRYGKELGAS